MQGGPIGGTPSADGSLLVAARNGTDTVSVVGTTLPVTQAVTASTNRSRSPRQCGSQPRAVSTRCRRWPTRSRVIDVATNTVLGTHPLALVRERPDTQPG